MNEKEAPEDTIRRASADLSRWLVESAYPLWASRGFDSARGGFYELLGHDGPRVQQPRRIRVQARQVYSFALGAALGWTGEAAGLVQGGLTYLRDHFRRPDGLFRTLVAPDGSPLDERVFLYDQAFVLLALAESQRVLGPQPRLVADATRLRDVLYTRLKAPDRGFNSGIPEALPLLANPHMHLLEAALAWAAISDDPAWQELADEIATLALERMIDARSGALLEQFTDDWLPIRGHPGPAVEPGHQFEWAWLLLRWNHTAPRKALQRAERLVAVGEIHAVHADVAVNALSEDLAVSDGAARLWPQTERIKATVHLAKLTREARYWSIAARAVAGFSRFIDDRTPGLWHDRLGTDDRFVVEPSPASSFYHIVSAITELRAACATDPNSVVARPP